MAFGWYGLVGQLFTQATPLFPSVVLNETLFSSLFGFSIQLFRAAMAVGAAIFVICFLHAFQVDIDTKITELQQAQLLESQQRETLRGELFRRVVAAQESERQRIARDLHDETGQSLTALGMGLRALSAKLPPRSKEALNTLHNLESLTTDSLKELQRLISDLRPSHLDDLGLSATLRWCTNRIQEDASIRIKLDISGEEQDMNNAMKITVFRIIQESLNNITKHSQASHVHIHLQYEESNIRINVKDNGTGFNINEVKQRHSHRPALGLAGMEERAALLGGTVSIYSGTDYGTQVEVLIPYTNEKFEEKDDHTTTSGG